MEKLLTTRGEIKSVPESYLLPPDSRPGDTASGIAIPVIDLGGIQFPGSDGLKIIQQLIQAAQEFGFFQVSNSIDEMNRILSGFAYQTVPYLLINHGVSEKLMEDVMEVGKELFELPDEEKEKLYSDDPNLSCRLYTSIDYANEKVHYWSDKIKHSCHPLDDYIQFWPQKPTRYREVVGEYCVEVRKLSLFLLDLIRQGLGIESGYFGDEMTKVQLLGINHYPPCPDPSLTLGLPRHSDVNLLTVLLQGNEGQGLQVLMNNGEWLPVNPPPNAFVVNIGHMLQIISNKVLKSADHRVVTNSRVARTSIASFIHPSPDSHIQPVKGLLGSSNPPLYKDFIYKDFLANFMVDTYNRVSPTERYEIHSNN